MISQMHQKKDTKKLVYTHKQRIHNMLVCEFCVCVDSDAPIHFSITKLRGTFQLN